MPRCKAFFLKKKGVIMERFANKETGEILKNIYKIDESVKIVSYRRRNYIIKDVDDGKIELIRYKEDFSVPEHTEADNVILTTLEEFQAFEVFTHRKFYKLKNGVAVPAREGVTIADFKASQLKGSRRAIKSFYDYALTNNWEYFVTLTFADEGYRSSSVLCSIAWSKFIKRLRYNYPDVKAIATFEEFEKGGYHLHALLSDVDLTLKPSRNNKALKSDGSANESFGKFIYSSVSGTQLFNCVDWGFGFNTVAILNPDSNNAQVVNYMSKYMNKCCPADYGSKRYYRTQNLTARDSVCGYLEENSGELEYLIERFGLKKVKIDKNGNEYYRNY